MNKVQVILPRAGAVNDYIDERPYKGRFLFALIDKHLKVIDIETFRLYDILSEPNFDQEAVCGMGLTRSLADRKSRLLMLCSGGLRDGSFVQKIEFNGSLPENLHLRV